MDILGKCGKSRGWVWEIKEEERFGGGVVVNSDLRVLVAVAAHGEMHSGAVFGLRPCGKCVVLPL